MNAPSRARPSFLTEAVARLQTALAGNNGSTITITKADACAFGKALTEPRAVDGDALVRNDDGSLDEVIGNGHYHLEQMDSGHWSLRLGRHLIGLHSTRAIKASFIENDLPAAQRNEGDGNE